MALSSRSQRYPRTASFCTGLAQRQGCGRCWIDALLQQWTRRGPGPQAQIGQALHVWPGQTSAVTATLAPCLLTGRGPFVRSLSSPGGASSFSPRVTSRHFKCVPGITCFLSSIASRLTEYWQISCSRKELWLLQSLLKQAGSLLLGMGHYY